jgi:methionine-gamma-lyase
MTHAPVAPEALSVAGISENLIRLSIGLECTEDLVTDVLGALDSTQAAVSPNRLAVAGH